MSTKLTYKILTGLLALMPLSSCLKEVALEDNGSEQVTVMISTGATVTRASVDPSLPGADPDYRVGSLRVLIFHSASEKLYKKTEKFTPPDQPQPIDMKTGRYDFFFIANEHRDPLLSDYLENTLAEGTDMSIVNSLIFASTAFTSKIQGGAAVLPDEKVEDTDTFIPMFNIVRNALVHKVGDAGRVKLAGEANYEPNPWVVELVHAGVRVDLTLNLTDAQLGATLSLSNIPDIVYLMGTYNYVAIAPITETAPRSLGAGTVGTKVDGKTPVTWSRIILPENYFPGKTEKTSGVLLTATIGGETYSARLHYKEDDITYYSLRRNTRLTISGSIAEPEVGIVLNTVDVETWGSTIPVPLPEED